MFEKFPKDWDSSRFQKIFERVMKNVKGDKSQEKALHDLSLELKSELATVEKNLSKKIAGKGGDRPQVPQHIPAPKNLSVLDLILFGLASCEPLQRWKFLQKARGFEFYGSHNTGFSPKPDPYTQTGVHRGSDSSAFLFTKDTTTPANTFYLEGILAGLTLENVTQESSGTITAFSRFSLARNTPFKLTVSDVTWDNGDVWRIKKYPKNRLLNIGSFSVFPKYPGKTFYVRARTEGQGHSYSAFTDQEDSTNRGDVDDVENFEAATYGGVYDWLGEVKQNVKVTWDEADDDEIANYDIKYWKEEIEDPIT